MREEEKPDPDKILAKIRKKENEEQEGSLKIFMGMSAGVGKTYAMLEEAQKKFKEGIDIVIGVINTHGRKETEQLAEGLPEIPLKWMQYKDSAFEELDVEAIKERKPQIVLIDELAHTNVPGANHQKRWQDVLEILESGISVFTTLNVQHVESRKETVEQFTGIQIRETVPDLIIERAKTIELIDIPPQELLQRLQEGKVYIGDQSKVAAENFFKVENLIALREIALRLTAEKVEHDLHVLVGGGKGWRIRERLLVAVSPSASSAQLIRSARKRAFMLDVNWIAIYVDTGRKLSDQEQGTLNHNLNLARELGAEVVITHDPDIASGIQRIALQRGITQIIVGRQPRRKKFFGFIQEPNLIGKIEEQNKGLDVIILRQDKPSKVFQKILREKSEPHSYLTYLLTIVFVAFMGFFGHFVELGLDHRAVGFFFLFGIIFLSLFVTLGPILLAAVLSTFIYDFFFAPPLFSLYVREWKDVVLITLYFIIATIVGSLTSKIRQQERFLKTREEKIGRLYSLEKELSSTADLADLRQIISDRLHYYFPGSFEILQKDAAGHLLIQTKNQTLKKEKEKAIAIWCFKSGQIAGRMTDTLSSAEGVYIPIKFSTAIVGVLAYFPAHNRSLSLDEMDFLQNTAQLLGFHIQRFLQEEQSRHYDYITQVEKTRNAIFQTVSSGLYEPVREIRNIIKETKKAPESCPQEYIKALEFSCNRMKIMIDNLLAIASLESGSATVHKKEADLKHLITEAIKEIRLETPYQNEVEVNAPENVKATIDLHSMHLAVKNVIMNALQASPAGKPVLINLIVQGPYIKIIVSDFGPGIPPEALPNLYQNFYQYPSLSIKGIGLGLTITKKVLDLHNGSIEIANRKGGGADVSLILPHRP